MPDPTPTGWFCSREPNHEGPCASQPVPDPTTAHGWTAPTVSDDDFPVPERDCPCPAVARLGEARTLAAEADEYHAADWTDQENAVGYYRAVGALLTLLREDTP